MKDVYQKYIDIIRLNWKKLVIFSLLLVFLASYVTYKIPLPTAEDLPRQMANGRDIMQGDFANLTQNVYSYTEPMHYFANHHWLYGLLAYISYKVVGWGGMVFFKVIFILVTFCLLFWASMRKADFWLVALCSFPTIIFLSARSSLRPEMFGYFFIVFYVYILLRFEENPEDRIIYWLIPVQLLWANLHITFPIGIMMVGGFIFEKIILNYREFWKDILVKKLVIVLIGISLVSFINPNGIKGVIYSLESNTTKGGSVVSAEVQPFFREDNDNPVSKTDPKSMFVYLLPITALSFVLGYKKKNIFYFLGISGSVLLTFKIYRSFPFFAIFFLLAVPANMNELFLRTKSFLVSRWDFKKIKVNNLIFVLFFISLTWAGISVYRILSQGFESGLGISKNAEASAEFFLENNLHGPIFNDTDTGSYLTWYLYPKEKVFADNRFGDAYSQEFWNNDYLLPMTDEKKWKELEEKYNFNVIFINQYDKGPGLRDFIFNRIHDPVWAFVYGDNYNVILLKRTQENQPVINKYEINFRNSAERFSYLTNSMDSRDQVTAADLFGLMGQVFYTKASFERAVAENPSWGKIWFILGKTELQRNDQANADTSLALLFLKEAIDNGWKTVNSYSFLALAYYRLGQYDQAKKAVQEELKLNKNSEDAQTWLKTFAKDDAARLLQKNEQQ